MARALGFDYPEALDRATRAFWRGGYATTSLRDLLRAMGIGEGSFYNTLKSKKNAYRQCLEHYDGTVIRERVGAFLAEPTAALGVRAFFRSILDGLDRPDAPRVCLMAGALSPDVLAEAELRAYLRDQLSAWTGGLAARFAADKGRGLLPEGFDPEVVAAVIVTYVQGLWRTALVDYDRPRIERQVDAFLSGLGL